MSSARPPKTASTRSSSRALAGLLEEFAFSRYWGMARATETSLMLRVPRASESEPLRVLERIASSFRARALARRPGSEAAMIGEFTGQEAHVALAESRARTVRQSPCRGGCVARALGGTRSQSCARDM
jgi:hypothetical protein